MPKFAMFSTKDSILLAVPDETVNLSKYQKIRAYRAHSLA